MEVGVSLSYLSADGVWILGVDDGAGLRKLIHVVDHVVDRLTVVEVQVESGAPRRKNDRQVFPQGEQVNFAGVGSRVHHRLDDRRKQFLLV